MHPIYWLKPASGHPEPPEHWTYSSLRLWRMCPKRWWLERCTYPNTEGGFYPNPQNAGALEGQLIHKVVEEWGKALRMGNDTIPMRTRFKVALRELYSRLKDNPRVDAARVIASVSLDTCVAKAFEFTRDLEPQAPRSQVNQSSIGDGTQSIPSGVEEFWVTVDDPPIKGQLDRVRNGVVTDYKTGAPDTGHKDQLLFYALLWWLKYGELPVRLELCYPGSIVDVPIPGADDLSKSVEDLQSELVDARNAIERGSATSFPSADTCRYCSVRQLCDDYWHSPATVELRLAVADKVSEKPTGVRFGDVQLAQFSTERRSDGAIIGEAMAVEIGSVRVEIGGHYCPSAAEPVSMVRMLGAKLIENRGEYSVTTAAGTEVFWVG